MEESHEWISGSNTGRNESELLKFNKQEATSKNEEKQQIKDNEHNENNAKNKLNSRQDLIQNVGTESNPFKSQD